MFARLLKRPRTEVPTEPSAAKPSYQQLEERVRELEAQLCKAQAEIERMRVPLTAEEKQGEKWKELFVSSDVFREHIQPQLGKTWTATLMEACGQARSLPRTERELVFMNGADATRSIPMLLWAKKRGYTLTKRTFCFAAKGGNLDVIKYLQAEKCPSDERACANAAEGGHLDVLKYLHENGCQWSKETCHSAAREGHLHVLRWARRNRCPWDRATVATEAAKNGRVHVLQYLKTLRFSFKKNLMRDAASKGRKNVIEFLREQGCPWNEEATCSAAAQGGHLNLLKYLHENGCPWNEYTCECAAGGGHLNVLKYAHENGCPWNEETCSRAAEGGHLHVLKYAHENGCPWDEETCASAPLSGSLDVLKYVRENGCPWDIMVFGGIILTQHLEMFQWVFQNGGDELFDIGYFIDVVEEGESEGDPPPLQIMDYVSSLSEAYKTLLHESGLYEAAYNYYSDGMCDCPACRGLY